MTILLCRRHNLSFPLLFLRLLSVLMPILQPLSSPPASLKAYKRSQDVPQEAELRTLKARRVLLLPAPKLKSWRGFVADSSTLSLVGIFQHKHPHFYRATESDNTLFLTSLMHRRVKGRPSKDFHLLVFTFIRVLPVVSSTLACLCREVDVRKNRLSHSAFFSPTSVGLPPQAGIECLSETRAAQPSASL